MKFSQRIGKVPITKHLQIESMDDDLKNGLWDILKIFLDGLRSPTIYGDHDEFSPFCSSIWHNYFKLPIDTIPRARYDCEEYIRRYFYKAEWYEVYDLLEFIASMDPNLLPEDTTILTKYYNQILEREFSGYRLIEGKIVPITNQIEIEEIEDAINKSGGFTSLKGANIHLNSALEKLSDRKAPDYRNSIKESISAIESVAKAISKKESDVFQAALERIKGKIGLHPALENGFKQLYNYTSSSDGIRHALMDDHNCDFEDAKYMLVSCSAFINYLAVKANKAGLIIK